MAQFICLLSKVAVVRAVPVSLRHSTAATIRHSAKAVNAIDCPIWTLPNRCWPTSIMDSRPIVMASPASPTVIITPVVSTDSPRGRGMRPMRPGRVTILVPGLRGGRCMTPGSDQHREAGPVFARIRR